MTQQFTPNPNDHELIAFMQSQDSTTNDTTKLSPEQAFIRRLVDTRLSNGQAQVSVAEKTGLPQSAIARIESGKGNPTLKTLVKLADAMGYQLTLLRKQD